MKTKYMTHNYLFVFHFNSISQSNCLYFFSSWKYGDDAFFV